MVTGLAGAVGLPTGLVTVGVLVTAAVVLCTQVWNYTTNHYRYTISLPLHNITTVTQYHYTISLPLHNITTATQYHYRYTISLPLHNTVAQYHFIITTISVTPQTPTITQKGKNWALCEW